MGVNDDLAPQATAGATCHTCGGVAGPGSGNRCGPACTDEAAGPETAGLSLDAELRKAPTPQAALDALHEALREMGRDMELHVRIYRGDLARDLARYVPRALSGELARLRAARREQQVEEVHARLDAVLARAGLGPL